MSDLKSKQGQVTRKKKKEKKKRRTLFPPIYLYVHVRNMLDHEMVLLFAYTSPRAPLSLFTD